MRLRRGRQSRFRIKMIVPVCEHMIADHLRMLE
jgi:hypothetical protein